MESEQLNEAITLDIDESNELAFKIKMEGTASSPAKVRLVCEGKDFSYMFNGYGTGEPEVVQFTLPQMSSKILEGTYNARVEVLVENRYFAPVQFQINFKKTLSVVAESIQVKSKSVQPELKVTAAPIFVQKPAKSQIKFEQKVTPEIVEQNLQPLSSNKFSSLKEAYLKKSNFTKEHDDELDENLLRQAARQLLNKKLSK